MQTRLSRESALEILRVNVSKNKKIYHKFVATVKKKTTRLIFCLGQG